MTLGYQPVFERAADGGWGAYVPELPGLGVVADTREQAEQLIAEGVRAHVGALQDQGFQVPAPQT